MNDERSDAELMESIATGDEEAMRELINRYQHIVYGTIVKMLGDPTEGEDIAQQVFLRVFRAAPTYKPTASFKTWIFTILRNLVFNEHRRRNRAWFEPIHQEETETSKEGDLDLPDKSTKSPDQAMLNNELIEAVDQAILALPEQQRLAVILRRYDEFSYEEIAAVLKTSIPATKSLLFRARESLHIALKAYLNEGNE